MGLSCNPGGQVAYQLAKIYLWDCRRTQILPNITGFKLKVKNKFETEKYVCMKKNALDKFNKK